jgi:hypothetical protein
VYQHYIAAGPQLLSSPEHFTGIPPEFALAAFRIGHSMVRHGYTVNQRDGRNHFLPMPKLFGELRDAPFTVKDAVDWHLIDRQHAGRIDTAIVQAMQRPPFDGTVRSIVEINLEQGSHLPGGPACVAYLEQHHPALADATQIQPLDNAMLERGRLGRLGLNVETLPLWLYILEEAFHGGSDGDRMGKLGSIIVAEVVLAAVRAAPVSVSDLLRDSFDEWSAALGTFGKYLAQVRPRTDRIRFLDVVDYLKEG